MQRKGVREPFFHSRASKGDGGLGPVSDRGLTNTNYKSMGSDSIDKRIRLDRASEAQPRSEPVVGRARISDYGLLKISSATSPCAKQRHAANGEWSCVRFANNFLTTTGNPSDTQPQWKPSDTEGKNAHQFMPRIAFGHAAYLFSRTWGLRRSGTEEAAKGLS